MKSINNLSDFMILQSSSAELYVANTVIPRLTSDPANEFFS